MSTVLYSLSDLSPEFRIGIFIGADTSGARVLFLGTKDQCAVQEKYRIDYVLERHIYNYNSLIDTKDYWCGERDLDLERRVYFRMRDLLNEQ